jgi:hypothetical protein
VGVDAILLSSPDVTQKHLKHPHLPLLCRVDKRGNQTWKDHCSLFTEP